MMGLETIKRMSREAAQRAASEGLKPLIIEAEDLDGDVIEMIRGIPDLGTHLPDGWKRVKLEREHGVYMGDNQGFGAFFVDASGFGRPGEPALTLREFIERLKPGLAYAIVEAGQFQVKIGVFEKK